MENVVQDISNIFNAHKERILSGEYGLLLGAYFSHFTLLDEGADKRVITLHYKEGVAETMPKQAQHVDVFVLGSGAELGDHYHDDATAEIKVLCGEGYAYVGPLVIPVKPGSEVIFQSSVIHNVSNTSNDKMAFLSLQDNPIIQSDGTLDYHLP